MRREKCVVTVRVSPNKQYAFPSRRTAKVLTWPCWFAPIGPPVPWNTPSRSTANSRSPRWGSIMPMPPPGMLGGGRGPGVERAHHGRVVESRD